MLKEKVGIIIEKRKKIHVNDPMVEKYWGELTELLVLNEIETINFLNNCDEEYVGWISEVFDDISEKLKSSKFLECLYDLEEKFPNLKLRSFIEDASNYVESLPENLKKETIQKELNIQWQEIKNTLDALQTASGQTYGKNKLRGLLHEITENKTIVVQTKDKEYIIKNQKDLQNLINTYDPNIKISDIV